MNTQTIAVALCTLVVGFVLGNITAGGSNSMLDLGTPVEKSAKNSANTTGTTNNSNPTPATGGNGAGVAFNLSVANLPEAQKSMLKAMGIKSENIQITNSMVACAEAEIGSARIGEIRNGSAPSMSEGITLMGCYSAG